MRKLLAIIGIGIGFGIVGIKFACLNTAIAMMHKELGEPLHNLQWIMAVFGIVMSSTLVTMGRLADLFGRKRLFLIAIAGLMLSQLGAGLSPSLGWILAFQAIFGLCSGVSLPVSQALLTALFGEEQRSKAVGIWTAISGIAIGSGPLLAGALVHLLGWRGSFLINVPLAVIAFFLVYRFVPDTKPLKEKARIDWAGLLLILFLIAPFILATNKWGEWPVRTVIGLYCLSVLSLITLVVVEKRVRDPILRLDLFKNRAFLSASLGNFFFVSFCWSIFFMIPFYLQTVKGLTPLTCGVMMLAATCTMSIISLFSKKQKNIRLGFVFLILSSLHLFIVDSASSLLFIISLLLCYGIGWGMLWNPIISTALSSLPQNETATASGAYITLQEMGGSVGLALTATVLKTQSSFLTGVHVAAYLLLAFCCFGFLTTFFARQSKKLQASVS